MRKRCRRKVYSTPAIPITFSMQKAGLNKCRLLGAAAIDSIVTGSGTEDHIAQLKQIADYCVLLCERLKRDDSVDGHALAEAEGTARNCMYGVHSMQARFDATGNVACDGVEQALMLAMLDLNDALDSVATRRQARDVMVEMIEAIAASSTINHPGDQDATPQQARE